MEPGEDIATCARRETLEETGIVVEIVGLVGIYSNPRHVVAYADGEVRQEFSVCFACRPIGGSLKVSVAMRKSSRVASSRSPRLANEKSSRVAM